MKASVKRSKVRSSKDDLLLLLLCAIAMCPSRRDVCWSDVLLCYKLRRLWATFGKNSLKFVHRAPRRPLTGWGALVRGECTGTSSIPKPVLHLDRDHGRIAPMGTAESVAVVQLIAHVRDVGAGEANGEILAEGFAYRQIEGGIAGQMVGAIAVEKAGAVVDGEGREATPRQVALDAGRKRVALIVVKKERPAWRWGKIGKTTGDSTDTLGQLVRVNEMSVIGMENQGRTDGGFLSLNDGSLNRKGQEDVGIANHVVVKEVPHAGVEIGNGGDPVSHRNGDAVLLLDVALASQRQKSQSLALGEIKQRTGNGVERRRLVKIRISGPQHPVQFRNCDGHAQPRIERVFRDASGKVRHPDSAGERQPGRRLELVLQKARKQIPAGIHPLAELLPRAVVGDHRKERVVLLCKRINPCASIVPSVERRQGDLAAFVVGGAIVRCDRDVVRPSLVSRSVEVIERRDDQHESWRIGVDPCAGREDVLFALAVVNARRLHVGIVRHLVVVEAKTAVETDLVFGIGIVDEGSESAAAVGLVVQVDASRRLEAPVRIVAADTGVIGELGGVVAKAQQVV